MATQLIPYAAAKRHLRLPDDHEQTDVEEKVQQATALVLTHLDRVDNEWTDATDPAVDLEFAIVQAAILETLGDLWTIREPGDERRPENETAGAFLRPNVRRKLHALRRPSLA